jgi:hypothetical protein
MPPRHLPTNLDMSRCRHALARRAAPRGLAPRRGPAAGAADEPTAPRAAAAARRPVTAIRTASRSRRARLAAAALLQRAGEHLPAQAAQLGVNGLHAPDEVVLDGIILCTLCPAGPPAAAQARCKERRSVAARRRASGRRHADLLGRARASLGKRRRCGRYGGGGPRVREAAGAGLALRQCLQ